MLLFNQEKIEKTKIEIYFKYKHLDVGELAELFTRLDFLYKNLLDNSYPVYYSEKVGKPFRNYLEVESINTGQSIRINFKEGWKPEFKINNNELEIGIPLNLGIPAIILYYLLTASQKMISIHNDYSDGQLKELEIKVKQIELYEKIENKERYESFYPKIRYQKEADDTINFIIRNQNINYIEINGMVIKNEVNRRE